MRLTESFLHDAGLTRFVAFDVETTGLEPEKCDVIQFSASVFEQGKLKETRSFFCKPQGPVPEFIQQLTRITDAMVEKENPFSDRIDEVLELFGDSPLVGHNVKFDLAFLEPHLSKPLNNPVIDTVELSRIFLYYLPDRKLESLAAHFKLQTEGAHRADVDTENTGELFLRLLDIMVYYDYPIYDQLATISGPLPQAPNTWLYQRFLTVYQNTGRFERENLSPLRTVPENAQGDFKRGGEESDESPDDVTLQKVNPGDIQNVFGMNGILSRKLKGYELRPGQIRFASDIVTVLNKGNALVGEAGTGVGKSLAYLIPAIKWVRKNRDARFSVVVSSNTKALQEQLFEKEIPFIQKQIDADFTATLLKGRKNYICLTRWDQFYQNLDGAVDIFDRPDVLPLIVWLRETKTGDIEENSGFRASRYTTIWSKICSETGYCTTKRCSGNGGCFLGKIRRKAQKSDLVVVNHSLLLSDAASDNQVLPDHPILIIDEAHNLAKSAYKYFAIEVGPWVIDQVLEMFFRQGRENFGLLVMLGRKINKLSLSDSLKNSLIKRMSIFEKETANMQRDSRLFFNRFLDYVNGNIRSMSQKYILKTRYKPHQHPFTLMGLDKARDALLVQFRKLVLDFTNFKEMLDKLPLKDRMAMSTLLDDFDTSLKNLEELKSNLETVLVPAHDDWVYWYEVPVDPKNFNIGFYAVPLAVDAYIYERILRRKHSVIATSATLTIAGSFEYFLKSTGFSRLEPSRLTAKMYESPFDYATQCAVYIPTFLGDPGHVKFEENVSDLLNEIAARYQPGMLVLATSYYSIKQLSERMHIPYKEENVPLIYQAGSASRSALLSRFRDSGNATLIGTESFWEGVDIPGDALEMLVMLKLPFAVPSEPIVEAITDRIKESGKNPFMEFSVPEAVIKFKQGFGRLIRHRNDTGVALFLDNRLNFKRYGRIFMDSLPGKYSFIRSREDFFKNLDFWFKRKRNNRS
jgi:predicted DnaQ family exonuclease/DinG family helicase